jgi:arylsulfatase A-like enzyme
MDKVRELGLDQNTLVFYTTDNGAWQDVYPDAGYTPFRGTKGTVREGGNRVPAIAWMPGRIPAGKKSHDVAGGLDLMATFAAVAGVELPKQDRAGEPIIFDSYDMSPILFGEGEWQRKSWFYFTEDELTPGAARVGNYKAVFNLRGDDGQATGGLAVDTNLGWRGPSKYTATVPKIFDLWQDPQERYDIFMNNYRAHLDPGDDQRGDPRPDENLSRAPAAQAAERGLHRSGHAHSVPVLSGGAGEARERGHRASDADRQLTCADREPVFR